MPPKKKQQGEASSSSMLVHFGRQLFWDVTATNNCSLLMTKGMHRERGVEFLGDDNVFIIHATQRHWEKSVKKPADAVKYFVREFYANLKVQHEDFRVRIRGQMIAFDSWTINDLYGIPSYEIDGMAMMGDPVDYETILRFLCVVGATWKLNMDGKVVKFESRYLKYDAYWWFLFIVTRLMPTNHTFDVKKERAILLHCILKKKTVDVGSLVQTSILHAARGTTTLSMPHSSLITNLFKHAGVTWDDALEELLPPKCPIDIYGVRKLKKRWAVGEVSGSG